MFPRRHAPAFAVTALIAALAGCPAPDVPAPDEQRLSVVPSFPPISRSPAQPWLATSPSPRPSAVRLPRVPAATPAPEQASATPPTCEAFGRVDTLVIAGAITKPAGAAVGADGHLWLALYDAHLVVELVPEDGCRWRLGRRVGGTAGELNDPRGLAFDPSGRWLYVADYANHRVRRLDTSAARPVVETFAGAGIGGFADGSAAEAWFWHPAGIAVDQAGAVYVADSYNHRIRKIAAAAGGALRVTTVAGGEQGAGPGRLNKPAGVAVERLPVNPNASPTPTPIPGAIEVVPELAPAIFVADTGNDRIVRFALPAPSPIVSASPTPAAGGPTLVMGPSGITWAVTVIAGAAGERGMVEGPAGASRLAGPTGLLYDGGALWIADTGNHAVRRLGSALAPAPVTTTFAGTGAGGALDGALDVATLKYPAAVARGLRGELFIADTDNGLVRIARGQQEAP